MARRILIVDDDQDNRDALAELLRSCGYEADVAADGCEAITLAMEHRPEVVLLDIGLPDMDGYDVGRRIRSGLGRDACRLIALTGSDEDAKQRTAPFDVYLVKPAELETLRLAIEGVSKRSA